MHKKSILQNLFKIRVCIFIYKEKALINSIFKSEPFVSAGTPAV